MNVRQTQFGKLQKFAGDKLISSFSEFANQRSLLSFTCTVCHLTFKSTATDYYNNNNCDCCSSSQHALISQFVDIHGHYYDYSLIKHTDNILNDIDVICPKHGKFNISIEKHLDSIGCDTCKIENVSQQNSITTFINKAHHVHDFTYQYKNVTSLDQSLLSITCPKHGEFHSSPSEHLDGIGCKICNKSNQTIKQLTSMLTNQGIAFSTEKTFSGCVSETGRALRFNVYIPQKHLCIEYDGIHHFQPTKYSDNVTDDQAQLYYDIQTRNDNIKHEYCKANNVSLIRIPYTEYHPAAIVEKYINILPDKRMIYLWDDFQLDISRMVNYIKTFNYGRFAVYGVSRGGVPFSVHISNHFEDTCEYGMVGFQRYDGDDKDVTHQIEHSDVNLPIFVVDDLTSSGITMNKVVNFLSNKYPNVDIHPIVIFGAHNEHDVFYIREHPQKWIVFPYEI